MSGIDQTGHIIAPPDLEQVLCELSQNQSKKILARSHYSVYLFKQHQMPTLMTEIGRSREHTFRMVGEGTGLPCDIDHYDEHYFQLLIWDDESDCVVGGYRLGHGASIFKNYGVQGFYVHSLFHIDPQIFPVLEQSLELGRSFIVPSYQKKPFPLFLLWQGILHFLNGHPEIQYLIGPVSISKYYSDISRSIIVSFIKKYCYNHDLAKFFSPRTDFHPCLGSIDLDRTFDSLAPELSDLEYFLNTIEPEHIKVPVLLKQYARQNARFLGFNLDPSFSHALDGLMLLDLRDLPKRTLENLRKE